MTSPQAIKSPGGKIIRIPRAAHPRFSSVSRPITWCEKLQANVSNSDDESLEDILTSIAEANSVKEIGPRGVKGVDYECVDRAAHPRFSSAPRQLPVLYGPDDLNIALIQLAVGSDKAKNIADAVRKIRKAKERGANLVVLPECFNSPYGKKYFDEYAEQVPTGETCTALSKVAAETGMFVVGGTIPERCGLHLFYTCTAWNGRGELIAIHRKKPFFNKDVSNDSVNDFNEIVYNEPEDFVTEDRVTTFNYGCLKIGIGICNDLRLINMTTLMAQEGCSLVIYLGTFDLTVGQKQWKLLGRARAIDLQLWVALVSPARDTKTEYTAWGHTMLINPLGKVVTSLGKRAGTLRGSVDLNTVEKVRRERPVRSRGLAES